MAFTYVRRTLWNVSAEPATLDDIDDLQKIWGSFCSIKISAQGARFLRVLIPEGEGSTTKS